MEKLKLNKIEASIILSVLITLIFSCSYGVLSFYDSCDEIRGSMLRLHVIANSDSQDDQSLKLMVRDAVLEEGEDIFDGSIDVQAAKTKLEPCVPRLESAAKDVIEENGFDYDVEIIIDEEYFDTRTYEQITLPAGYYTAVRVVIGRGEGQNWWCVMFPPMCLPAVQGETSIDAYLEDDEVRLVESNPRYEPRFKVVEIYEKLRNYIDENSINSIN